MNILCRLILAHKTVIQIVILQVHHLIVIHLVQVNHNQNVIENEKENIQAVK